MRWAVGCIPVVVWEQFGEESCRRWMKLFTGFWRDSGQAPSLALPGGTLIRGAQGRHKAYPYRSGGGMAETLRMAGEGRHKACPYWSVWGE